MPCKTCDLPVKVPPIQKTRWAARWLCVSKGLNATFPSSRTQEIYPKNKSKEENKLVVRIASPRLNLAKDAIIFRMPYRLRETLEDVPLEEVNDDQSKMTH
jgi:hypothetical protein